MSQSDYLALQERLLPLIDRPNVEVGPLLNGFLLTGTATQQAEFPTWTSDHLLTSVWEFVGIDTYQSGTAASPGSIDPGDRIPPLVAFLQAHGVPNDPIVVGEYNGFTAQAITDAGETFLSTPNVTHALMWNSQVAGGKGVVLSGDRLAAFQGTKADVRALHEEGC